MNPNINPNPWEGDVILEPGRETRVFQVEITVCNCEDANKLDEEWVRRAVGEALPYHFENEFTVRLLQAPRNIPQGP